VKAKCKIFLVDDHKLFREGLSFVISQMEGFEVVGEAPNGEVFLKMIDDLDVDIVLMDISMPDLDGIAATSRVLEKRPDLKVIVLTMFDEEEYYSKMIQAGVSGYILKESGKEELAKAINTVFMGETYFPQKLLDYFVSNLNNPKSFKESAKRKQYVLTPRENEILKLICQGFSNAEIAERFSLSLRTIEGHKSNLMSKTGVNNSTSLVMFAINNHLVDI
jgi:DNA-binding NarL/FixJ family response regulator